MPEFARLPLDKCPQIVYTVTIANKNAGTEEDGAMSAIDAIREYQAEMIVDEDGNELVQPEDRCGFCGERRMDWLKWVGFQDLVKCATCGTVYRPSSEEE